MDKEYTLGQIWKMLQSSNSASERVAGHINEYINTGGYLIFVLSIFLFTILVFYIIKRSTKNSLINKWWLILAIIFTYVIESAIINWSSEIQLAFTIVLFKQ